jgi:hypothetical protein
VEHARAFARAARLSAGLDPAGWRAFRAERLRTPIERLFAGTRDGRVILRSELEEELSEGLRLPSRRGRHTAGPGA